MKKRVISAIVMGAIFIPIFIIGRIPFVVAIALLGAQAYREMILLQLDNKKIIMLNTIFVFVVKYNIQL
jgi:CDP-diglyceride synthetase